MLKIFRYLIGSNTELFIFSVFAVGSLILRFQSDVATYISISVLSLIMLNISMAMRRTGYWILIAVYSIYILGFTLLSLVSYNTLFLSFSSFGIDMAFIIFVFIVLILTQHLYSDSIRNVLSVLTPVTILIGVIFGIYIGLTNPLRYIALAILDAASSAIIISIEKRLFISLAKCLLIFIALYFHPIPGFNLIMLLPILFLHLVRNLALIFNKPFYAKTTLLLDIALRPAVAWLL